MSCNRVPIIFAIFTALAVSFADYSNATSATPASASVTSDDQAQALALVLVQRFNLGGNLESLANQEARTKLMFNVIVQTHGYPGAIQVVKVEISKMLPACQGLWNNNLALVYSKRFSAEELRSLVALGTSSPYAEKFESPRTRAEVGAEMGAGPLLEQLVHEALLRALDR